MENNLPPVTVLIANHNYGKFVENAIQSAHDQTYENINIAVVDDGSSDDSWDRIADSLFPAGFKEKSFPEGIVRTGSFNKRRLWAVKLPKAGGPSLARNVGIQSWLPQTFAFQVLDADDMMKSNKVEILVQQLLQSPHVGVAYADYENWHIESNRYIREYKEPFDRLRLLGECIVHSGAMIRAEALDKLKNQCGYYNINYRVCEDWELWIRLSKHYIFMHVPESLTIVRVHQQNSTNTVANREWNRHWAMLRQQIEREYAGNP